VNSQEAIQSELAARHAERVASRLETLGMITIKATRNYRTINVYVEESR
jgi:hypothetical protein